MSVSPTNDRNLSRVMDGSFEGSREDAGTGSVSPDLRNVVSTILQSTTIPPFQGAKNIDRLDKGGNFQRYLFPNIGVGHYAHSVAPLSNFYDRVTVGIGFYEDPIGCYAAVILEKLRVQSEYDYSEVIQKLDLERNFLHTRAELRPVDRQYNPNPLKYKEGMLALRRIQQKALIEIARQWKATEKFEDVFVPDIRFRKDVLGEPAEMFCCTDKILFRFKRLLAEESDEMPTTVEMLPPLAERIDAITERFRLLNRTPLERVAEALRRESPSQWSYTSGRRFSAADESAAEAPSSAQPPEEIPLIGQPPPPPGRAENPQGARESLFFQAWRGLCSIFAAIFGFFFSFFRC